MEVKTVETVIPARTKILTVYVATDGREFFDEDACRDWESYLDQQEHHVFKTCVQGVRMLDDKSATLYNIRNDEDYELLLNTIIGRQRHNLSSEYMKCGPGWYICLTADTGNGPNYYDLWNYDAYLQERETDLANWKATMASKMAEALNK